VLVRAVAVMFRERRILGLALFLWLAQACLLGILAPGLTKAFLSELAELAIGVLIVVGSFQAVRRSGPFGRMFWSLAGTGLSLLAIGIALVTYNNSFLSSLRSFHLHWWGVDVFLYSWTAPLVMCLFLDPEGELEETDWQRIFDFSQVAIVFVLLQLYSSNLAVLGQTPQPWGLALITDGLITVGFFVRAASTEIAPVRALFWRFGYFRLVASLTDLIFVLGVPEPHTGEWFDLVWSGTLLIALVAAVAWNDGGQAVSASHAPSLHRRLLVTQLLPLIFPVLVLMMAARIARGRLVLAAAATLVSLAVSYARLLVTQRQQQRSEEALHRSLGLLQAITEGANEAIFVKDLQGRYVMTNTAAAQWQGRTVKDLIGKDDLELFPVETAQIMKETDLRVIQTGAPHTSELVFEEPSGTRTFLSTKSPYLDSQGKIIGVIGVAVDITEKRKLEHQLGLSSRLEAIGTLSGGVAHDFNNLLTVILGYNSMILDAEQDLRLRSCAEQIHAAAERAVTLTRQLLAFSRRQVLQPKVLDLNSLLLNLDKMLQRLIGEDVEMVTLAAPDLGLIKADPSQIEQVIMNLVVNARDAMPDGGKLTLESANVDLDETYAREHMDVLPGRYVMLAISDTGIGMAPATLASVFEPFFTTKTMGRGTGLGLSMVYGIVKQSGGSISVYSELGHGTTFKVYLPLVDELPESRQGQPRSNASSRGTETILLVEDDREVRELAHSILIGCGYSVLEADGPLAGTSLCEQYAGTIHLLLTDVVMPAMSGREFAMRIVARRPGIKVLYMSGYTNNAIVHHGVLDTGLFFLPKPFTPALLAGKVREVLDVSAPAG
jgi:PAS domain S-box-containing protein